MNKLFKKNHTTILLTILLIIGIGITSYPFLSEYYNSRHQTEVVGDYEKKVKSIDSNKKNNILSNAKKYNEQLPKSDIPNLNLTDDKNISYNSELNVDKSGIMAFVEIPKISKKLPIYHGTSKEVLEVAIGHIPGTSLPVGGLGTHAVISGHRGLPSAKLFTDIDQLENGDLFYIHVFNKKLAYEVDQILTVEPDDVSALKIEDKKDLVTLVTCTPYGVNSHRLLVRGHRIPYNKAGEVGISEAILMEPLKVIAFISTLLALIVVLFLKIWDLYRKLN